MKRFVKARLQRVIAAYLPTQRLRPVIRYAHFFSQYLQASHAHDGIAPEQARVIYHGVPEVVVAPRPFPRAGKPVKLLYCGQLLEWKGVHTAIEAVAQLVHEHGMTNLALTIIGPQPIPPYVERLRQLITELQLEPIVTLRPPIARAALTAVYQAHDILLFPSIWDEPFSITLLEAMAHGLFVIGTPTGGSAEILRDGENSFVVPPRDAAALAQWSSPFM